MAKKKDAVLDVAPDVVEPKEMYAHYSPLPSGGSPVVVRRAEFVYVIEVNMSNPNGDPDNDNRPRTTLAERGWITQQCLNRACRDYVGENYGHMPGHGLHQARGGARHWLNAHAYKIAGIKPPATKAKDAAVVLGVLKSLCWDIRALGGVLGAKKTPAGSLTGPIQIGNSISVDPIYVHCAGLTNSSVCSDREEKDQMKKNGCIIGTMGRSWLVDFGVYVARGTLCVSTAKKSGLTQKDLEIYWEALMNMWEDQVTSSKKDVEARKLVVFQHCDKKGKGVCKRHENFRRVKIVKNCEEEPRSWEDYDFSINTDDLPDGLEIIEMM